MVPRENKKAVMQPDYTRERPLLAVIGYPTCALLGGSKTSVTCPLSEVSCGFEGVVGLWDDGFRPAPIIGNNRK
jgi:hypothetical protein